MLEQIIEEIKREIRLAEHKHPNWPTDPIHAAAIVAEESGELIQSAIQFKNEGGSINAIEREGIQTAATAIRFLQNISSYKI